MNSCGKPYRNVLKWQQSVGLVLKTKQAKEVASRCVEKGLLVLTAKTLVRLLPPLTISQEELEQGIAILKEVLTEI